MRLLTVILRGIKPQSNAFQWHCYFAGRMGNASKALDLITEHASDVSRAVEFCKEQNDSQLWDELIDKSIHKPSKSACE